MKQNKTVFRGENYTLNNKQRAVWNHLLRNHAQGRKVPTHEFTRPDTGGNCGDRRLRELKSMGLPIDKTWVKSEFYWFIKPCSKKVENILEGDKNRVKS